MITSNSPVKSDDDSLVGGTANPVETGIDAGADSTETCPFGLDVVGSAMSDASAELDVFEMSVGTVADESADFAVSGIDVSAPSEAGNLAGGGVRSPTKRPAVLGDAFEQPPTINTNIASRAPRRIELPCTAPPPPTMLPYWTTIAQGLGPRNVVPTTGNPTERL